MRIRVHNKYYEHCAYCGEYLPFDKMQVDHFIPKRRGIKTEHHSDFGKPIGDDSYGNLMPSCRSCNISKSDWLIDEWREILNDRTRQLSKQATYRIAKRYGLVVETNNKVVFHFETYDNG